MALEEQEAFTAEALAAAEEAQAEVAERQAAAELRERLEAAGQAESDAARVAMERQTSRQQSKTSPRTNSIIQRAVLAAFTKF